MIKTNWSGQLALALALLPAGFRNQDSSQQSSDKSESSQATSLVKQEKSDSFSTTMREMKGELFLDRNSGIGLVLKGVGGSESVFFVSNLEKPVAQLLHNRGYSGNNINHSQSFSGEIEAIRRGDVLVLTDSAGNSIKFLKADKLVADGVNSKTTYINLPESRGLEYVAKISDGRELVITNSRFDNSYEAYKAFVGKKDSMKEIKILNVERYLDGGSTLIETNEGTYYFPHSKGVRGLGNKPLFINEKGDKLSMTEQARYGKEAEKHAKTLGVRVDPENSGLPTVKIPEAHSISNDIKKLKLHDSASELSKSEFERTKFNLLALTPAPENLEDVEKSQAHIYVDKYAVYWTRTVSGKIYYRDRGTNWKNAETGKEK